MNVKKTTNLERLAQIFADMPTIGKKSAWKLAFHILSLEKEKVFDIANTIIKARETTRRCKLCQNLTDEEICYICSDVKRDKSIICVVESPKDVLAFEKSSSFFGVYHVLHGLLSPMDGIGPKQITIKELINNIKNNKKIKEVILATSPTLEGEATAMYISKILKSYEITKTRLAYGISVGTELQYADNMTISKAIENRSNI